MKAPINRHLKSLISKRKNATKIVIKIKEHDKKKDSDSINVITIKLDPDNTILLEEIGNSYNIEP